MTIPNQLSLEALIDDDGMDCRAGLPESLRQQLDEARRRDEQAVVLRERADTILTAITAHESQIAKLHDELRHVIREYAHTNALKTSTVPAI